MPTTAIKNLRPHPAQMRTTYDLEALAALTLQVYERDLNEWQPIVAAVKPGLNNAANGDGPGDGGSAGDAGSYHIVSGHRRHMARLLAFALEDWASERPETDISIEVVRTMITALVESLGSLEKVIASLLVKYGQREIAFVPFEGSQKAEILALQAANYGSERPDALGMAHSFRQAVSAGAGEAEIARNSGQHANFVRNHLALTEIPPELANRIAAGELPMSVAAAVAELPEPKRSGLAIFILANEPGKLTAKALKQCAATLKQWPGLHMPLMVKHQSQRNVARALVRLWGQAVETYPENAYAAAAMFIYRELHEEPWAGREKLALWFQALGGDIYFHEGGGGNGQGGINWPAVVEHLLPEISCATCPIGQLPRQALRSDLSQGQGGPLGMPCRVFGEAHAANADETAARCLHGLAEGDPFDCRVPWDWSQHPGVVHEGEYRVKSYEQLLQAWQAQAAKEQAEDEAAAQPAAADAQTTGASAETAVKKTAGKSAAGTSKSQAAAESAPAEASPSADGPIVKQRATIASFMKGHEQLAATHPFATPCGRCRHRLESSPTKDDSVPHCAWAGRLRQVSFKVLAPAGGGDAPRIPVCRQFAPNQPWPELIPGHPNPPGVPREWLKEQILLLVKECNRYGSSRNGFEFLTGRPLGANEHYGDWFEQQLAGCIGELSLEQLFSLFLWAHAEWQRAKGSEFSLPVNGSGVQFVTYREAKWPVAE